MVAASHLESSKGRQLGPNSPVVGSTSSHPDTHGATDVYRLRKSTYWTVCDLNGKFVIPGVPAGDNYTLFVFDNGAA